MLFFRVAPPGSLRPQRTVRANFPAYRSGTLKALPAKGNPAVLPVFISYKSSHLSASFCTSGARTSPGGVAPTPYWSKRGIVEEAKSLLRLVCLLLQCITKPGGEFAVFTEKAVSKTRKNKLFKKENSKLETT
jgi:hypothetical protein